MSASWHSIADFSALVHPPGRILMGAFKGYFDESGDDGAPHNALAFCGYVCTLDGWAAFENEWGKALAENECPYLHMKELQNPNGQLSRFAGKANQEHCNKLLSDLAEVIKTSKFVCAGTLIRLPDLKEFNAGKGLNLESLPLAMYATMGELARLFMNDTLELVVDRLSKPEQAIAMAVDYASSYIHDDVSRRMSWSPLKGENSFRNIIPIQAADFVAWEARKEHERINEWWRQSKRGLAAKEWISNFTLWLTLQNKTWPNHRKSFAALTKATKIHAGVLDYDALCHLHDVRGGVWSNAKAGAQSF